MPDASEFHLAMIKSNITLAAKCAPGKNILSFIKDAGIKAVELYLSQEIMRDIGSIADLCATFPFSYALHAPNDCHNPAAVERLAREIGANIVVFHDIFWEDEWKETAAVFKDSPAKMCIENIKCVHDPLKIMRRYKAARCLDLEHFQMECSGMHEDELIPAMKEASHIHITGYNSGSRLWHTHIHHSPLHGNYLLDLLAKSGYTGMAVSEAAVKYQTAEEFKRLHLFFTEWQTSQQLHSTAA